jgi:hypothetical protein
VIYFARIVDGSIKIGHTVNLVSRIKSFPGGRYGREVVCILGVHDGDRLIEKSLHERFANLRIKRLATGSHPEDFRAEPELIQYILNHCQVTPEVMAANCSIVDKCMKFRKAVIQDLREKLDEIDGYWERATGPLPWSVPASSAATVS